MAMSLEDCVLGHLPPPSGTCWGLLAGPLFLRPLCARWVWQGAGTDRHTAAGPLCPAEGGPEHLVRS